MRKILYTLSIAIAFILCSCEEFEPAYAKYDTYKQEKLYTESEFRQETATVTATDTILPTRITISDLKAKYEAVMTPININENIYVKGQVISSDSTGNFYKSIFIQDETTGIELKLGKYNLYNEYKLGQWVYVKLRDLTVGAYYGSIQIGFKDESGKYETSYLDVQRFIDTHVFRGERATPIKPTVLSEADLKDWKSRCCGTLVTLQGLKHMGEIFCLVYRNPNLPSDQRDKNHGYERIFLSDKQWGVTTWAMSKSKFEEYLNSGVWDTAVQAAGEPDPEDPSKTLTPKTVAEMRANGEIVPSAYTVSQYFKFGSTSIGLRTSGYSKFCDWQIPSTVLDGSQTVNLTGVITYYSSSSEFQFTVSSLEDIEYPKN